MFLLFQSKGMHICIQLQLAIFRLILKEQLDSRDLAKSYKRRPMASNACMVNLYVQPAAAWLSLAEKEST